jgi:hypothetical protein
VNINENYFNTWNRRDKSEIEVPVAEITCIATTWRRNYHYFYGGSAYVLIVP